MLRDDAWGGVEGILELVGAIVVVWYFARRSVSRVYWWTYDQYYEHVHWRLYGPPRGFDEAVTLTAKVAGSIHIHRDGNGQKRARRLDANRRVIKDQPLYE